MVLPVVAGARGEEARNPMEEREAPATATALEEENAKKDSRAPSDVLYAVENPTAGGVSARRAGL